ncbi:circularly permutated Ras protein 1-like [Dysidea avara]|uniref:circularly permutated Ras protein 1-like n=1 Tax=Dysidea avara TaxID=196820 RepID=UPI003323509C
MDFGSKFVYEYNDSEEEYISGEEYEVGMYLSDSEGSGDEDGAPQRPTIIPEGAGVPPSYRTPPPPRGSSPPPPSSGALVPQAPPPPAPQSGVNRLLGALKKRTNWLKKGTATNQTGRGRTARQADTNVIAVKFNTLTEPSHMHTGDAVVCSNKDCTAILSHMSKLKQNTETGAKTWQCEFCGTLNVAELEPEEVPTKDDTTFMIAPAPVNTDQGASGGVESLIIFCVDISGSMCVTTEVSGKFQLKGHSRVAGLSSLNVDGEDQYMPRQKRDVTYVSRLQSVQAAVDHQLNDFSKTQPHTKISLVTFNNEVTVFGDGKNNAVTITGDKLNNNDELVKIGSEVALPGSIKDTSKSLSDKLFSLEESGSTALGPALVVSIAMAAKVPGSRVVVCTDGLANVGLGSLDELKTEEQVKQGQQFYEKLGTDAVDKGVVVSLVSIKGTECRVVELGQVASQTGGQVTIVDPLTLTQQFSTILANPIIATNVVTRLILHSGLYFRHEDYQNASCVTIQVGNVTADTELTYEYGVRTKKHKEDTPPPVPMDTASASGTGGTTEQKDEKMDATTPADTTTPTADTKTTDGGAASGGGGATPTPDTPPLMMDGKECLPFQLQISYTSLDGAQCNRVITQAKPITKDRQVAEAGSNVQVLGAHVAKTTAKMALEGEYTKARTKALVNQRLVQRVGHAYHRKDEYRAWVKNVAPMENMMNDFQKKERVTFGRSYSDEECEDELVPIATKSAASSMQKLAPKVKKKKAYKRRGESSDVTSEVFYSNMARKTDDFL